MTFCVKNWIIFLKKSFMEKNMSNTNVSTCMVRTYVTNRFVPEWNELDMRKNENRHLNDFFLENVEYFLILGHFRSNVTVLFPLSVFFDNGMVPYGIEPVIRLIVLNIFISKNRKRWKNNIILFWKVFQETVHTITFFKIRTFVSSFFFRETMFSFYYISVYN